MPSPLLGQARPDKWLPYWHAALGEKVGVFIRTPDPNQLKSLLYSSRARSKDPSIAHLQIRTSPVDPRGEILIFNPNCISVG